MLRRLAHFRSLGLIAGARAAVVLLQAVTVGAQARAVGVSGFGTLVSIQATCYLALTVTEFGLSTRALRIGQEQEPALVRRMTTLRLVTVMLLIPVSLIWSQTHDGRWIATLPLAAASFVAGDVCGDLATSVWLGQRKPALAMGVLLARRLACILPFVAGLTYGAFIAGLFASGIVGVAVAVWIAATSPGGALTYRALIRSTLPYWTSSMVTSIQRFDVLLIGAFGSAQLTGLYAGATRYSNAINTGTSILLQYSVPEMSHQSTAEGARRRHRQLQMMVTGYAGLLILFAPFGVPITKLLLGEGFAAAWPIMSAVFIAAALSALTQGHLAWHMFDGLRHQISVRLGIASLATLVLIAVAAPMGIWPVGLALVLGTSVGYVLLRVPSGKSDAADEKTSGID